MMLCIFMNIHRIKVMYLLTLPEHLRDHPQFLVGFVLLILQLYMLCHVYYCLSVCLSPFQPCRCQFFFSIDEFDSSDFPSIQGKEPRAHAIENKVREMLDCGEIYQFIYTDGTQHQTFATLKWDWGLGPQEYFGKLCAKFCILRRNKL